MYTVPEDGETGRTIRFQPRTIQGISDKWGLAISGASGTTSLTRYPSERAGEAEGIVVASFTEDGSYIDEMSLDGWYSFNTDAATAIRLV